MKRNKKPLDREQLLEQMRGGGITTPVLMLTALGQASDQVKGLRAGADDGATGENAVVVGCRRADVILGPIGIVMADALLGEITPAMAQAVAQSDARRILIPANRCDTLVVGVSAPIGTLVEQAAAAVLDGCRN